MAWCRGGTVFGGQYWRFYSTPEKNGEKDGDTVFGGLYLGDLLYFGIVVNFSFPIGPLSKTDPRAD